MQVYIFYEGPIIPSDHVKYNNGIIICRLPNLTAHSLSMNAASLQIMLNLKKTYDIQIEITIGCIFMFLIISNYAGCVT